MNKQVTVKQLLKLCQEEVKKGNGEKFIVVADDNEGIGWVVNIPLDELEEIVKIEKNKKEKKLLGYCERCGEAVYSDEPHAEKDGVYYCDCCLWEIENGYGE